MRVRILVTVLAALACRGRDSASQVQSRDAPRSAPETRTANDSVRAVRALRDAIVARDSGQSRSRFRVVVFVREEGAYRITLISEPASTGGGGRALVTQAGQVRDLEMFR